MPIFDLWCSGLVDATASLHPKSLKLQGDEMVGLFSEVRPEKETS